MMKRFIKSMLLAKQGSISSKRVCGILGWLVCLSICIYCTFKQIQAPILADSVLIGSAALLGVDSIMRPFKFKDTKNK